MPGLCTAVLVATMLAPPEGPPPSPPGGYWSTSELRERRGAPRDGEDEIVIGSVLFSLGLLRVAAAGVTVWLARNPSQCPGTDAQACRSMEIYGWAGFGEGGLMFGTGLTYLIIGAVRRDRYRRWAGGEQVARPASRSLTLARPPKLELGPWLLGSPSDSRRFPVGGDPAGGGAQLRLRF